jgi:hypothetical protein
MPIYGYQGRLGVQDDQMQQYLNQARGQNPIGRLGQLSNFAALEQAAQARTAQQKQAAEQAAQQFGQLAQQEASAAEQRAQVARSQQLQEQQQRLEQERFNQQLALQRQQLEEQKSYRDAQTAQSRPQPFYADYSALRLGSAYVDPLQRNLAAGMSYDQARQAANAEYAQRAGQPGSGILLSGYGGGR